jgi:hypothetical protein
VAHSQFEGCWIFAAENLTVVRTHLGESRCTAWVPSQVTVVMVEGCLSEKALELSLPTEFCLLSHTASAEEAVVLREEL